jgi:hypothetical protein
MSRRDTTIVWGWRVVLVALVLGGLVAAIKGSLRTVHPEIVVETCSFLSALTVVMLEQRARRIGRRRGALEHLVEELRANAVALCSDDVVLDCSAILTQVSDNKSGLRFYYPRLTTTATVAGLLSGALDGGGDRDLASRLSRWTASAERCNGRLAMAELLLFFLPATDSGMRERLELHLSILSGPVARQRAEVASLARDIGNLAEGGVIPKSLAATTTGTLGLLDEFVRNYTVVGELEAHLGVERPDG